MKLDIYNSENIKSLSTDIYNPPSVLVLCHTTFRDYKAGEEYKLIPEVHDDCILCWINNSPKPKKRSSGNRFAIVGNVELGGEPIWVNFLNYFICPIARERNEKLKEIGI